MIATVHATLTFNVSSRSMVIAPIRANVIADALDCGVLHTCLVLQRSSYGSALARKERRLVRDRWRSTAAMLVALLVALTLDVPSRSVLIAPVQANMIAAGGVLSVYLVLL